MIKRADYLNYHKLLQDKGVMDNDLLEEMIENALEEAYLILDNSHHILAPEDGYDCDCGYTAEWNAPNWTCPNCGHIYSWDELYENVETYTEQEGKLVNIIGHLENAEDLHHRAAWFEILLQFTHGSGRMAKYFIEGGYMTLSEFSVPAEQKELDRIFWEDHVNERQNA